MSKKLIETPKASSKPDDLIKPKTKDGKRDTSELSDEEVAPVSGGVSFKIKW